MNEKEINEAVARKFGWILKKTIYNVGPSRMNWFDGEINKGPYPPDYCTDIKAAWELGESLGNDWAVHIHFFNGGKDTKRSCSCQIYHYEVTRNPGDKRYSSAEADTAPMAICLAFLKLP